MIYIIRIFSKTVQNKTYVSAVSAPKFVKFMVLKLDGNSEIGARVWSEIDNFDLFKIDRSRKSFFLRKRSVILHVFATCS